MFSYVSLLRDRFSLRINEDDHVFYYWHQLGRKWQTIGEMTLSSGSATVRGLFGGSKILVSSRYNLEQTIVLVNLVTNQTIGSIIIDTNGSVKISTQPAWEFNGKLAGIPDHWINRMTALLAVKGPCTINVKDICGNDEDILRLKPAERRWFVPARYTEHTTRYDLVTSERDAIVREAVVLPDCGQQQKVTITVVDSDQAPSTSGVTTVKEETKKRVSRHSSSEESDFGDMTAIGGEINDGDDKQEPPQNVSNVEIDDDK